MIPSSNKPLCNVSEMIYGNKPVEGGQLFLDDEEKADMLAKEPKAERFIRKILGYQEFINGESRWCLWLKGVAPSDWRSLTEVVKRVEAVKKYRLESPREATRKLAEIPYLFGEIRHPETAFLIIRLYPQSAENMCHSVLQRKM